MFSPIKWMKPRLKPLCVAYGIADMTLVLLSLLGWYFFFNIGFQAQHNHNLREFQAHSNLQPSTTPATKDVKPLQKEKTHKSAEELRLQRSIRACGIDRYSDGLVHAHADDKDFAGPAALIGASMGGYFILGALLISLNNLDNPAARKVICSVCLFGQGIFTLFIILATAILVGDEGLCPTEYYFESFQPLTFLSAITLIFVFSYKSYEVTIILFYLNDLVKIVEKEVLKSEALHESEKRESIGRRSTKSERPTTAEPITETDQPKSEVDNAKFYNYVDGGTPGTA